MPDYLSVPLCFIKNKRLAMMRLKQELMHLWFILAASSLKTIAVIFSVRTQPHVEVTSVLFVSVALQPDLDMISTASGGVQLSSKTNTQMHTGAPLSATTHTRPQMQRFGI